MNDDNCEASKRNLVITSNIVSSEDLLGRSSAVLIRHGGYFYQLRKTKQNKLILTK